MAGTPVVVRTSELEVVALLEERLAPFRIPNPGLEPRVSLVVSRSEDGRRSTNSVHRDGWTVRTTHSLDAALDTVERVLLTCGPQPDGVATFHARVLERDGAAVLVTDTFRDALDGHHRRVAQAGFVDALVAPVLVDPLAAEVLLPAGTPDAPHWRRVPVRSVVAFAPSDDADSPAVRVTHFTALVTGRGRPTNGADVQALVDLMEGVPFVRIDESLPGPVARRLVELAAAD